MPDAILKFEGGELTLPEIRSVDGSNGYDVNSLLKTTGNVALDYGFMNTASCESRITFIDGDKGILRYRGYPIEQLAEHSSFLETTYLLIKGQLPTQSELTEFEDLITHHTMIDEGLKHFFDGFPRDAHPMPMLSSAVNALSTFYPDQLDPFNDDDVWMATIRMIAKLPTLAAAAARKRAGLPFMYPENSRSYVENFLYMTFGVPAEPYVVHPEVVEALDTLFILHADHEQNCSTSTVRLVGSSHANLFASVSAGINALFGPLHGGANQAVLEMLEAIHASGDGVEDFIRKVKNREDGIRLMGFGHRVYKNYDPRAAIIKGRADRVLHLLGVDDPLFDIALRLEEAALHDDFFIERKLYPNVDFYTGLIYRAMGFQASMFTVLFAIGRLPGWVAQWQEMMKDPETKIGRPRQIYIGEPERPYQRIEHR